MFLTLLSNSPSRAILGRFFAFWSKIMSKTQFWGVFLLALQHLLIASGGAMRVGNDDGGDKKRPTHFSRSLLWSIADSNCLPQHCQCCALPDELIPQSECKYKWFTFIMQIFVPPRRIERLAQEPESWILSIKLRGQLAFLRKFTESLQSLRAPRYLT